VQVSCAVRAGDGRAAGKLRPDRLDEARRSLDQITQQWSAALDRLDAFVTDRQG